MSARPAPGLPSSTGFTIGASLVAAAMLVSISGALDPLDRVLFDAGQRAWRLHAPEPAPIEIVVVGIDSATFVTFPEPFALWHARLGTIFAGIAQAQPRAVGIDIELPDRSFDAIRPGGDLALLRGLTPLTRASPTVLARGLDASGRVKPVFAPFLAVLGYDGSALAAWEADADGVVRRFTTHFAGASVVPFAGRIAQRLGRPVGDGLIDWRIGATFDYVPAHHVYEWSRLGDRARLEDALGGRVVLLGSVLPFEDRHRAPLSMAAWERSDTTPGVLLHAQALRGLLGPGLIVPFAPSVPALLAGFGALLWFSGRRSVVAVAALAGFIVVLVAAGLVALTAGRHLVLAPALVGACVATVARLVREAWAGHRQRRWLEHAFAGAVSPNVLELIVSGEIDDPAGSGRRRLAVMFGDIRDFTPLTEHSAPEQVVDLLNRYFTCIAACVHRFDGTIDNFRGDGIMCFFGAPRPVDDPAQRGFAAARAIFEGVGRLNQELQGEGRTPITIGLSLALGEAVVGRIGAANRHEYTAIGDVANLAARLEGLTRDLGYPLLVNIHVAQSLAPDVRFDDLGEQTIKGHAPVQVFGWPARANADAANTTMREIDHRDTPPARLGGASVQSDPGGGQS
ncbi:MAG: adenylate/guanylate cyclase domain-containing protein [Proteobacteria bacterium]|nr:adenylate/guanylate cyclase domain-containing protein [Burkholderiales bacterium]